MTEEIKVGDKVRSYDFEGVDDFYVEGVVESIEKERWDCPRYKIRVSLQVNQGERVGYYYGDEYFVYPPVNGTPKSLGGVCKFVEKIDGD